MDKVGAGNQRRYSGSGASGPDSVTKTVSPRKKSDSDTVPTTRGGFHDMFKADITRPGTDEKRTHSAHRPGSSFGVVNLDLVDIKLDEDDMGQPQPQQSESASSAEPPSPSRKVTPPNGLNSNDKSSKQA